MQGITLLAMVSMDRLDSSSRVFVVYHPATTFAEMLRKTTTMHQRFTNETMVVTKSITKDRQTVHKDLSSQMAN